MGVKQKQKPLRRRDMGVAGLVLLLSQCYSDYRSTHTVSEEIKDLRSSVQQIRLERETFFVKKEDFKSLQANFDVLKDQLYTIREQLKHIRSDYSLSSYKAPFVGDRIHTLGCPYAISTSTRFRGGL